MAEKRRWIKNPVGKLWYNQNLGMSVSFAELQAEINDADPDGTIPWDINKVEDLLERIAMRKQQELKTIS